MEILHTSDTGRFVHIIGDNMVANECKRCIHFELKEDEYGKYGYCDFCEDEINLNYCGDCNCQFTNR